MRREPRDIIERDGAEVGIGALARDVRHGMDGSDGDDAVGIVPHGMPEHIERASHVRGAGIRLELTTEVPGRPDRRRDARRRSNPVEPGFERSDLLAVDPARGAKGARRHEGDRLGPSRG